MKAFVGLPLDRKRGQRLVEVSNPLRWANTALGSLINWLERLKTISQGFALPAQLETTGARAMASYAFMPWVGIVGVEIAFEKGI